MKKTLMALSLAAALVSGSAMAHDATFSVIPVLVHDNVDFIGFDNRTAAENFAKVHNLPATVVKQQNQRDFHIMLVDIKQNNSGVGGSR